MAKAKLIEGRCPHCGGGPLRGGRIEYSEATGRIEQKCPECGFANLLAVQPRIRMGRPTQAPVVGERVQIGVQVSPKVKALLEAAAEHNHRSMSREAEFRLESSFERERHAETLKRIETLIAALAADQHAPRAPVTRPPKLHVVEHDSKGRLNLSAPKARITRRKVQK